MNTTVNDIYESFESSFKEKTVIPEALEFVWLKRAVGRYSIELDSINLNELTREFDCKLSQYTIDTLAAFMLQMYEEREWSRVNKQVSIVGKDLSIDGAGHTKNAVKAKVEYSNAESSKMISNLKPTAYS